MGHGSILHSPVAELLLLPNASILFAARALQILPDHFEQHLQPQAVTTGITSSPIWEPMIPAYSLLVFAALILGRRATAGASSLNLARQF